MAKSWDSLKKALKADYDETLWDHLAGAQKQIALKVIDDRGNEWLVVKSLV